MAPKEKNKGDEVNNFKTQLKEIAAILEWFDAQEELDVEEALKKVKEAARLIKASKERLSEVENEFKVLKKEIEG